MTTDNFILCVCTNHSTMLMVSVSSAYVRIDILCVLIYILMIILLHSLVGDYVFIPI